MQGAIEAYKAHGTEGKMPPPELGVVAWRQAVYTAVCDALEGLERSGALAAGARKVLDLEKWSAVPVRVPAPTPPLAMTE